LLSSRTPYPYLSGAKETEVERMNCKCGIEMSNFMGYWFCECGNGYDPIEDYWINGDEE